MTGDNMMIGGFTDMEYTAKIEQTFAHRKRLRYMPGTDSFEEKDCDSLSYIKGFRQPSGWIKESGTPPCEHLDVIVMTDEPYKPGDELPVRIIGVFRRVDGDHKLVAVPAGRAAEDLSELSGQELEALRGLYDALYDGEGWFGRKEAEDAVSAFFSRRKRKIIITVQHTESEHHVNGCIGAWQDWDLTERGRQQAFEIGRWLLCEDCHRGFSMFISPQLRARNTAVEINRTLSVSEISVTEALREVNAGEGNGKSAEWYRAHEAPRGKDFDPDYKPFPDAESDRELWDRLYPFYGEIIDSPLERILIVSHGTTLSFLHSMLMGQTVDGRGRFRFSGTSGSISKFTVEPDGRVIARYINHTIF